MTTKMIVIDKEIELKALLVTRAVKIGREKENKVIIGEEIAGDGVTIAMIVKEGEPLEEVKQQ